MGKVAVDLLVATAFPGDPLGVNSKKAWARKPGKQGRQGPEIRGAYLDTSGQLEKILMGDPIVAGLPMLARWDPGGRDHYHRGGDLEEIASELEQALMRSAGGSDLEPVLTAVLALVRDAISGGLILHVSFD